MEVVINSYFGYFGLSIVGKMLYGEKKYGTVYFYDKIDEKLRKIQYDPNTKYNELQNDVRFFVAKRDLGDLVNFNEVGSELILNRTLDNLENRTDPALIATVKELGDEANSQFSRLKIIDIPDDVKWDIQSYDGKEEIVERHRTWE